MSQLDLVLPKDSHDAFLRRLGDKGTLRHAKVYLKLQDIVDGEFFNDYIKTGMLIPHQSPCPEALLTA